jgi:hypothetical protein
MPLARIAPADAARSQKTPARPPPALARFPGEVVIKYLSNINTINNMKQTKLAYEQERVVLAAGFDEALNCPTRAASKRLGQIENGAIHRNGCVLRRCDI